MCYAEDLPRREAPESTPAWDRWPTAPTPQETASLFTLSTDQVLPFMVYATVLKAERDGKPQPQLLSVLTGEASCRKSRTLQALLWYAFQIDALHMIAVVAYTWRACMLLGTPFKAAITTSSFFGINTFDDDSVRMGGPTAQKVSINLATLKMIICDEISFISCSHLYGVDQAIRVYGPNRDCKLPFQGLHTGWLGDILQLQSPGGIALWSNTAKFSVASALGRSLWRTFTTVFRLRAQHRLKIGDTDGQELYRFAQLFMSPQPATFDQMANLCDALQRRVQQGALTYSS